MTEGPDVKILTVVGARPQFIKASALSRAIAARVGVREVLVHTGQHYDSNMSGVFFDELGMRPPDRFLGIADHSHGKMTGQMLGALDEAMVEERPDAVLVYGDTNSTLAGALAAAKLHIPVAHVEAGLRSFNRRMPEEVNRVLADHASTWLFCPTDQAVANLRAEGITANVHNVGDIMFDVALAARTRAQSSDALEQHGVEQGRYVLATVHRQENTDDPRRLRAIFDALMTVAERWPVVLPLHPRTDKALRGLGIDPAASPVRVVAPLGYLDMTCLEERAALIVTDSGGVQKEAFFYRVPCVTVRDDTEWVELLSAGWNRLADAGSPTLAADILAAIGSAGDEAFSPYGDGTTAQRILAVLVAEGMR